MKRVKILGAGSIGNHLAHAARRLGCSVDLCDIDPAALERTRAGIYPKRYGVWDEEIRLFTMSDAPVGGYDLICVGTPPDSHMPLALKALGENPRALLVEKPLCGPGLAGVQELAERAEAAGIDVFAGYDHVAGAAAEAVAGWIAGPGGRDDAITIDVEFREHWGGIFAAHPWLDGPGDSYLGFWQRGGGACGEHSHAINLWQYFSHLAGGGRVTEVSATLDYVDDGLVCYDRLAALTLRTESGLVGRVVQDVVTSPPRKWGRIQGADGYIEWHSGYKPGCDAAFMKLGDDDIVERLIPKTRPDDFIRELQHIFDAVNGGREACALSPLRLERALETMLVIAAAHLSSSRGRAVAVGYGAGCTPSALKLA